MAWTRFSRRTLYRSTALGGLLLSGGVLLPVHAQEVIGGSDTVVVDGSGDGTTGTQNSPWSINNELLFVGRYSGDDSELIIRNGGSVIDNPSSIIGFFSGASGKVTVTGAESSWAVDYSIRVGKSGNGTLTISDRGTVDVGGELTIAQDAGATGTLNVGAAAGETAVGAGSLNAASLLFGAGAGSMVFNHTDTDYTFSTEISGAGTISHLAGTTTFTADSSGFAGDTFVDSGTLAITGQLGGNYGAIGRMAGLSGTVKVTGSGANWSSASDLIVGVQGNGALLISDGGNVDNSFGAIGFAPASTAAVTVSGAGSVWKNRSDLSVGHLGTGSLTISDGAIVSNNLGSIGFYGGSAGTVSVVGVGSAWANRGGPFFVGYEGDGRLTISDGGTVDVDNAAVTIARNLSATGTLNIGAATGDTAVGAGTLLNASLLRFGVGDGTLVFNHTDTDYNFSTEISGAGTINHLAGVTNLTAGSPAFTGTTNVTGGTLIVNHALGGAVNVSGGSLGGSGALGTLAVRSGGTVAPGNSIGTLNVADITIDAGSTYQVEVNGAGNSDLIIASNTVTINGGTVAVIPFPDYALGTPYTIVTAAAGVTGTFDTARFGNGSLFITPTLTYDANNAFVSLAQTTDLADVAATPNQIAAAEGIQSVGSGEVLNAILLIGSNAEVQAAFDAASGEIHSSAQTALLEDSRFVREAAIGRTRAVFDGVASDQVDEQKISEGFAFWGQGFGAWGDWDGDGNAGGLERSIGGLFLGGDARVSDNVRVGALAGYSHASFSSAARASSAAVESGYAALHGGGQWGALGLRVGGAYGWHDVETARAVAFTGFSDYLAASYDAATAQAFGEAAWRIEAGTNTRLEPFANVAYVNLDTDAFTETGGAAALWGNSDQFDAPFLTLGVRADTAFLLGQAKVRLTGSLGWQHMFGNDVPLALMTFVAGGSPFGIAGVPLAEDVLVVDAGLGVTLAPDATLGLTYGGQFGAEFIDQSVKGGVSVKF